MKLMIEIQCECITQQANKYKLTKSKLKLLAGLIKFIAVAV